MATLPPPLRKFFQDQLRFADASNETIRLLLHEGDRVDISSAGKTISSAYEQLRTAAENSEEHLLLQRAVKRFFKLNIFTARLHTTELGTELITELVLSGYIANSSVSKKAAGHLNAITETYKKSYDTLLSVGVKRESAMEWTLACLSTEVADLIDPHSRNQALVALAYQSFLNALDKSHPQTKDNFELSLYVAVHQALLHSDIDIVRADIRSLYDISPLDTERFAAQNKEIDYIFGSRLTARLRRLVSRRGAPFRIVKGMLHDSHGLSVLLDNQAMFMDAFRQQISREYSRSSKRLNNGLIKSILFIFITKMIIGVAIEIPYDLISRSEIAWTPLIINLLFPPLYMGLLRASVVMPAANNARRLMDAIQTTLFTDHIPHIPMSRERQLSPIKQLAYTIIFALPIAALIAGLYALHFNVIQMIIFFVFFSTASSLGFRLTSQVRELETERNHTGFFASIRDFFYMPFIVIGQWLTSKYRQFNFVGRLLDIVIELPLKAVLRLVRQWIRFLDDRREELY